MSGWQGSPPRPPGSELPTRGDCWHYTLKLAARVGLAPTPCGLTNRRATLTPPGNGTAGRTSTCIVPLRRRVPHVFGHGSIRNGQRDRSCTCDPSVPGRVRWLLRYALIGGPEGNCTLNPPADNGALCFLSYESEMACRAVAADLNGSPPSLRLRQAPFAIRHADGEGRWEVLVTLQLVASSFV